MSHFLDRLTFFNRVAGEFSGGHGVVTREDRSWEDGYRKRWQHDKIVRSTHGANCTGSCSWKIYVKGGIVTWETQQTDYPRTRTAYALRSANALWGQAGHPFRAAFLRECQAQYGAGLGQVDFKTATEAARRTINAWVGEQTRTRIPQLIPVGMLDPMARLVLTNAVYFQAAWQRGYDFAQGATQEADFHAANGPTRCMLMRQTDELLHHAAEGMDLAVLPYCGGTMELVLLVPQAHDGLAAVEAALAAGQFRAWRAAAAGSCDTNSIATAYVPGAGSATPSRVNSRFRNACGSCTSRPAPSPESGSQPQAPRCSRFSSTRMPRSTTSCDFSPRTLATKPTPQASCSKAGS